MCSISPRPPALMMLFAFLTLIICGILEAHELDIHGTCGCVDTVRDDSKCAVA